MLKENKIIKPSISAPKLRKSGKTRYAVAATGIFAILVSHFLFQFFYIQNENIRAPEELVKTEKFEANDQMAEMPAKPDVPKIVEAKDIVEEEELDQAEDPSATETESKTNNKQHKEIKRKSRNVSTPIRSRSNSTPIQRVIKKKVPQETRAERLRRAEKILTGA